MRPSTQSRKIGKRPEIRAGGFSGVLEHGCEASVAAPPAMVLTVPIGDTSSGGAGYGTAVVCMPLDDAYVANSAVKLGVELALARGGTRFAKSPASPPEASTRSGIARPSRTSGRARGRSRASRPSR